MGLLFLTPIEGSSQLLFYQDTYKGGISSDGKSYWKVDYLSSDTIPFLCSIPVGSSIRKAYLLSMRFAYYSALSLDSVPKKDNPVDLIYNGVPLTIDSNDIVTSLFFCDTYVPSARGNMVVKDVTALTQASNNVLITPCQSCNIINKNWQYVMDSFILLIEYENSSMPLVNTAVILNDKTYSTYIPYSLNQLNPIDNTGDVGLSIWTNELDAWHVPMNFSLQSSLGYYYLGRLYDNSYHLVSEENHHLPGSFYYQNKTLFGLDDDTPDSKIDSTDALANISSFISNNTSSFTIYDSAQADAGCEYNLLGFILAYSSPCPPLSNTSISQTYTICNSNSVSLVGESGPGYSYYWYPATSLNDTSLQNPVASPTVTTNYILTISDSNGCRHTQQHTVKVFNTPKILSSSIVDPDSCNESKGTITAGHIGDGLSPYIYNLGGANQSTASFSSLSAGSYTLTITNNAGCSYHQALVVSNINPAHALITANPHSGGAPLNVTLSNYSTGVNSYVWYADSNVFTSQNLNYTFTTSGTYTVIMIAEYDGKPQCSDTAYSVIYVYNDSLSLIAPNIFSPNGDGINDVWLPMYSAAGYQMMNYQLTIYDRWGTKIFESTDVNKGWNGYSPNGTASSDGVYFYVLNFSATDGTANKTKSDVLKGFLQLIK